MIHRGKYRLLTRSDFDGLVCAIILNELQMVDEIEFVHPKDMQDGKINVSERDITTNLPYVDGVYLAFDHHSSETIRNKFIHPNHIIDPDSPSTSRVLYNYFGRKEKLSPISEEMLLAVDKTDGGYFTKEDILYPRNWELLNFILDPRSGLGRFQDFHKTNTKLMLDLIPVASRAPIGEILALPPIKTRTDLYFRYEDDFKEQIHRCASEYNDLVMVDLREEKTIYPGNRFMVYALSPLSTLSLHVFWGLNQQNTVIAMGKSIFKRTSPVNIGEMMLEYGGGGHAYAGTTQVPNAEAERVIREILKRVELD